MKTIKIGTGAEEHTLGGETVLFRHEKTFVSKPRYAVALCTCMDDATVEAKLAEIPKVDYDRIGDMLHFSRYRSGLPPGSDGRPLLTRLPRKHRWELPPACSETQMGAAFPSSAPKGQRPSPEGTEGGACSQGIPRSTHMSCAQRAGNRCAPNQQCSSARPPAGFRA